MAVIKNVIETLFTSKGAKKVVNDTDQIGRAQTRLGQVSASSGRQFSSQAQGLGGLVAVYAGAAANIFAIQQAFSALAKAARAEQTLKGFKTLAAQSGRTSSEVLKSIQDITKGQLTTVEAATAASLALSAGLGAQLEGLVSVAFGASRALGRDLTDSIQRVVRGAAKLEPELLDELGIFVRIDPAVRKYAEGLGKSASQLTEFERRQAFANALLEEGNQKFQNIDTFSNTAASSIEKLAATFIDLATEVGILLANVLQPLADFFGNTLGNKVLLAVATFGIVFATLRKQLSGFLQFATITFANKLVNTFSLVPKTVSGAVAISAERSRKAFEKSGVIAAGLTPQARETTRRTRQDVQLLAGGAGISVFEAKQRSKALEGSISELKERRKELIKQARAERETGGVTDKTRNALIRVRKQYRGSKAAQEAYNEAALRGNIAQRALAGGLLATGRGLQAFGTVASSVLGVLGPIGIGLGILQGVLSLFGVDILGGIVNLFRKLGEESRRLKEGIDSLSQSFVIQSNVFNLSKKDLVEINEEVSDFFETVIRRRDKLLTLGPRGRRRITQASPELVQYADTKLIKSFEGELTKLNKTIAEGGEESLKAATKYQVLSKFFGFIKKNGIEAFKALSTVQAITGVTTAQLAKLGQTPTGLAKLRTDAKNTKKVFLDLGKETLQLTDSRGKFIKFGSPIAAQIVALTAGFEDFNESLARGAFNSEGAAKALGALRNRYKTITESIKLLELTNKSLSKEEQKRLDTFNRSKPILEDQIKLSEKFVQRLKASEDATKAIQKIYKSDVGALEQGIFSGAVSTTGAVAVDPIEQAKNRAKIVESILKSTTKETEQEIKRREVLKSQLASLQYQQLTLESIRGGKIELEQINREIAKLEKKIKDSSSEELERRKRIRVTIQGALGTMLRVTQEAEKLSKELEKQVRQRKLALEVAQNQLQIDQLNNQIALRNARLETTNQELNNRIAINNLQIQINRAGAQAAVQAISNEKALLDVKKESLDTERKIIDAREEAAFTREQTRGQAELAVLQRRLAAQQAFPNLVSQEELRRTREEIIEKEYQLQLDIIKRKEEQALKEYERSLQDIDRKEKGFEIEERLIKARAASATTGYELEKENLVLRNQIEQNRLTNELKNLEDRKEILRIETATQLAQLKAQSDESELQVSLLEKRVELINKEFENQKAILSSRSKIVVEERKNVLNQLLLAGKITAERNKLGESDINTFIKKFEKNLKISITKINPDLEKLKKLNEDISINNATRISKNEEARTKIIDEKIMKTRKEQQQEDKLFKKRIEQLNSRGAVAAASAKGELEQLAERRNNLVQERELAKDTLDKRRAELNQERQNAKDANRERIEALQRERDLTSKIFDRISGVIQDRLGSSIKSLVTAINEGTLSAENFKQGLRDLFVGIVTDIQTILLEETVINPIKEIIKEFIGTGKTIADAIEGNSVRVKVVNPEYQPTAKDPLTAKDRDTFSLYTQKQQQEAVSGLTEEQKGLAEAYVYSAGIAKKNSEKTKQASFDFSQFGGIVALTLSSILSGAKSWQAAIVPIILGVLKLLQQGLKADAGKSGGIGGIFDFIGSLFTGSASSSSSYSTAAIVQGAYDIGYTSGGLVKQMAAGGLQRDRIPARLEPGEFVLRKPVVSQIGVPTLQRMNATGNLQQGSNVVVNVNNQGTPQETEGQPKVSVTPEAVIVDIVTKDLRNNGPIRKSIRGSL